MKLQPGIHEGVPMRDYLMDPAAEPSLSNSIAATLVDQSPFHAAFKHPRITLSSAVDVGAAEYDGNAATAIGTVAHAILLEGSEDCMQVIDADHYKTKAAQQARDLAILDGKHPVLAVRVADVRRMADVAREYVARSDIRGMLEPGMGRAELTMIWNDGGDYPDPANPDTFVPPLWCRSRPDWLTNDNNLLLHFKTTQGSAQPEQWIRSQLVNMGYDVAFAFYLRGAKVLVGGGVSDPASCFLVQEAKPPHCCSLISLDPMMHDLADRKVRYAMDQWRQCIASQRWPAYSTRIQYASPKPWHETDFAEREMGAAYDERQARDGLQA